MKSIVLLVLCAFFMGTSLMAQQEAVSKNVEAPEVIIPEPTILYVIKIPNNLENVEQIGYLKKTKANEVEIVENSKELLLLYRGNEFTSELEPSFINDIQIYKGDKAKEKYPSAPSGGVIEMKVDDVDALVRVYHAIKAS